jgi:hypothetical protein
VTPASISSRLDALRTMISIAHRWTPKPRAAEIELLTERANAGLVDLQWLYANRDRIRAALGPDAAREDAK